MIVVCLLTCGSFVYIYLTILVKKFVRNLFYLGLSKYMQIPLKHFFISLKSSCKMNIEHKIEEMEKEIGLLTSSSNPMTAFCQ